MPPEPVPWDRKEFRKHDSGGGGGGGSGNLGFGVGGGGGGGPRWREPPFPHHHPYSHRNNHHGGGAPPRWVPDFRYRRPPGYVKQGSRHIYHEDFGHGFMTPRANGKMVEDESCQPSGSGRYSRSNRENRGSFSQKDCKGQLTETFSVPNGPGRPNNTTDQRSVKDMPTNNSSVPISVSTNSRDQSQQKDQHDINGPVAAVCSTGHKLEREKSLNSIDGRKSQKWTRSGSSSSSFSHSCSSKSMAPESDEMKVELMPKNVTSTQSPTGDAAATCVASVALSEEMKSRKKPRVGWGEGLAKYEKKKVEVPDDSAIKDEATVCDSNLEPGHCQVLNLTNNCVEGVGISDCGSPATPSSVACSSSPDLEEKVLVKEGTFDHNSANLCSPPSVVSQNHSAGSTFKLENLDLTLFSHVNLSINELLHSDDPSSVDTSYGSSTAMNKLLVLKNDISKVLEATESEIDRLENELKSLNSEPENNYACLATSSSVPAEYDSKPREDYSAASSITLRPTTLQLVPSGCMFVEDADNASKDDQDVDSPGSATSKFVEMPSSVNDVCLTNVLKDVEGIVDADENKSENVGVEFLMDGISEAKAIDFSATGVEPQLIISSSVTTSGDIFQPGRENILYESILADNKDCAHRASEVLNKLLCSTEFDFDISSVAIASSVETVKGRFLRRKRSLRLKERIITLKFKMLQHLWKEETRLLSMKKSRAKSQKKFDCSLRTVNSGYQKHRSFIRSRYLSTASSLSLEPTSEMLSYACKLLSEPQVEPHRNMLKMPEMIWDKQEKMASRFISSNGLVEDPCAEDKGRSMINPWTSEEKRIFLEKLTIFGKNFKEISSFLDHKTTADCIEFYYKNHKSDSFKGTKKEKPDIAKQAKSCAADTYLIASGKRRNREANAVSLDILGAASALAANVDNSLKIQQNCTSPSFFALSSSSRTPRGDDGLLQRSSSSLDLYNDERETVAADVLAGICGSLSSEAMGSCITSSIDPGEGYQDWRYQRVGSSTKRPLTPEVTQNVDDETSSGESCGEMDPTDWSDEEKSRFIQAVSSYGRDFTMISRFVRTRTQDQCKVFFSKARKCLGLDMICPEPGNLAIDDANGGGSDMEDACIVSECCEKSGFKMEEDIPSPDIKLKHDPNRVGMTNAKPELNRVEEENEVGAIDSTDPVPMSKNLIPDDCQMEDKPELDFDENSGIENGASSELISVQGQENVHRNSDQEAAKSAQGINDHNLPNGGGTEARSGDVNANSAYVDHPTIKLEGQGLLLREDNLNFDNVVKAESCPGDINSVRCSLQDNQSENGQAGNDSYSAADTNSYAIQQKTGLELDPARKPCDIASQESSCVARLVARPRISYTTKVGKSGDNASSVLDKASRASGHSAVEHLESSCILRGYPVPVTSMKEMGSNISFRQSSPYQSFKQSEGVNFDPYSARVSYLQRCNSSKSVSSGAETSLPSQEQSRDCSRPTSGSPSNAHGSNRDVKLFGQILSNTQHPIVSKSAEVKSPSNQMGDRHPAKNESINLGGSENLAPGVDFWDRNKIQNGFSSLSDSSRLLAKYPSAFGNYLAPSSKMDQLPLLGVGKNGECNVNGLSVFPTRDLRDSNNGLADFQVYRNQELQPFTIDTRQQHDFLYSEMQRRNGFDVVSGAQPQSRGMVGINVVGRGGVFVGAQCTGVSDPVAALRMHYSKSEQFSGQTGNIVSDDDSWRGKGKLGR